MERRPCEARGDAGTGWDVRLVAAEIPRERKYAWLGISVTGGWAAAYLVLRLLQLQEAEAQNPGRATWPPLNQSGRTVRTGRRTTGVAACPRSMMSFGTNTGRAVRCGEVAAENAHSQRSLTGRGCCQLVPSSATESAGWHSATTPGSGLDKFV